MLGSSVPRRVHARGARSGSSHRGTALLAGFGALLIGTTACTGSGASGLLRKTAATQAVSSPAPATGVPANLKSFYTQRLKWTGCGADLQCSKLKVPINYAKPSQGTIELALIRQPAAKQSQRLGSLVVNPGGPGGSGVDYVKQGNVVTQRLAQRYDIVGFDPRGVSRSAPVECLNTAQLDAYLSEDPVPSTQSEINQEIASDRNFGKQCEAKSSKILPYVGTNNAARDMDVLRGALGDKKLNYMGKSYGTFLGATYAQEFPTHVGRFVLDGALNPELSAQQINLAQAASFQKEIGLFIADCVKQGGCPLGNTQAAAESRLQSFLNGLQDHPLPGSGSRKLTQALGLTGVIVAMYDQVAWPLLKQALQQGLRGNGAMLLRLSDIYNDRGPDGYTDNEDEANAAINCLDHPESLTVAQVKQQLPTYTKASPLFGPMLAWSNIGCAYWPVKSSSKPHAISAKGAAPIVVVGTTNDPATPYAWAKALASQLSSGRLLTYNGDGHTAYNRGPSGSTCIDNNVDAYFISGTLPKPGTVCQPSS